MPRLESGGGEDRRLQTEEEVSVRIRTALAIAMVAGIVAMNPALAQDLGPRVTRLAEGVYVHKGNGFDSNSGIIITSEGAVVIDTGQTAIDAHSIMATVKKLTNLPVRMVIDTEPHGDHALGHFLFSPPAVVIAAAGAGESMRTMVPPVPERIQKAAGSSPAMKAALEGFRMVTPHIEYKDRTTLNIGGRTIELIHLKGVHSEADTAVWLPKERVLFSASAFVANQINIFRPFVNIADILAAGKLMKALNPEHVVPGHGAPGTAKLFDDGERYYALLLDRVRPLVQAGKTLAEIQKEVKMPEYASWASQDRMPTNIDAAWRAVTGK